MALWRVDSILNRVARGAGDPKLQNFSKTEILQEMTEIEKELCLEFLAIKAEDDITTVAEQEEYVVDPAYDKILQITEPTTWLNRVQFTNDLNLWADWKRLTLDADQPLYSIVWNGIFHLWPEPTTSGELVHAFFAKKPTADLALGANPSVSSTWDYALQIGTVARLKNDLNLRKAYQAEARRAHRIDNNEAIANIPRIEHSSNDLMF